VYLIPCCLWRGTGTGTGTGTGSIRVTFPLPTFPPLCLFVSLSLRSQQFSNEMDLHTFYISHVPSNLVVTILHESCSQPFVIYDFTLYIHRRSSSKCQTAAGSSQQSSFSYCKATGSTQAHRHTDRHTGTHADMGGGRRASGDRAVISAGLRKLRRPGKAMRRFAMHAMQDTAPVAL
jgi:hypothetical protein